MNTGIYTAKDWLLSASSGTLAYILDVDTYKEIDDFRNFVATHEHTSIEDYLLEFYTLHL